ncbi:hypothetical protein GCM10025868_35040 [Angustibacter aerolatus]|uniref:Secreted protein n=1 Tax=Angustibacter aerolatus TaxID=1162965 RepID=A0ABQ6JLN5_9ACTN|nr:hypothetical protein GCM10025868_35040 [Angustibacter aerolatus]
MPTLSAFALVALLLLDEPEPAVSSLLLPHALSARAAAAATARVVVTRRKGCLLRSWGTEARRSWEPGETTSAATAHRTVRGAG